MMIYALLNEAVNEKGITKPSEILYEVRKGIISSLKQKGSEDEQKDGLPSETLVKDGMDAALCNLTYRKTDTVRQVTDASVCLEYAGALN
ncbi:MAG: hypothetical protein ABII90_11155 [Bacteroidota bacterium]